jgi:hypothetical protein
MVAVMILSDHIRAALGAFTQHTGASIGSVSSRALDEGKALRLFMDGTQSLTLPRAERLLQWLSDHWPASLAWPEELPRPAATLSASAPADAPRCATSGPRGPEPSPPAVPPVAGGEAAISKGAM